MERIDPALNLDRKDYRDMTVPKYDGSRPPETVVTVEKSAPPVPQLAEILAAPRPPKIGETQLVSLSVTDDVPLKDVLLELAKLADVDIELDAGISGGISFIAKEKPFNEVIERIANLADLRYSMKNGVLRVERDTPYIKSYSIDFLNLDRDSESSVTLSTNVLSTSVGSGGGSSSGGGGSSGGAVSTGSTSTVKSKTKSDFWTSLETGVEQVLAYKPALKISHTTLQAETDTNTLVSSKSAAPAAPAANASPAAQNATANASSSSASSDAKKDYTINRQAGILSLNATSKQHEMVEMLLNKLKANTSAQVLIEAKIIEVDLNEQYKTGINWSEIGNKASAGLTFNTLGNAVASASPTTSLATISIANGDFQALLSLVESFGTTRTLSSPRLHAINNQPSTLTFATNYVYFDVKVTQAQTTSTTTGSVLQPSTVTATPQTVPIGIIMSILPSIDMENNEVTLSVHPTLSSLAGSVKDPSVAYLNVAGVENAVPQIQVRDLDSTVRMQSGQTMVIGGLMQQTGDNQDSGVPFASDVPVLGNLFKSVSRTHTNKELVLLIKATIVDTKGSLNRTDKNVFDKFSTDPRPVSF